MNRRGFLGAMLGAAMAPAVVKAENIMKIWVPSQEIIVDPYGLDTPEYTVAGWMKPREGQWMHVAQVMEAGAMVAYINGVRVPDNMPEVATFQKIMVPVVKEKQLMLDGQVFDGFVNDLKVVTKSVPRLDIRTDTSSFENAINLG